MVQQRQTMTRRILYKLEHVQPLQLGMSVAEQLWLDSISLEELCRYLRGVNKKRRKVGCSAQYLGVHRTKKGGDRPWRAMLYKTDDKQRHLLWSQYFEDEESAARARDQAALQYFGRCVQAAARRVCYLACGYSRRAVIRVALSKPVQLCRLCPQQVQPPLAPVLGY